MRIPTEHQNLFRCNRNPLRLPHLIPIHINFDRFKCQILHTQVLTLFDYLLLVIQPTNNQNSLVETAENTSLSRRKICRADGRVFQHKMIIFERDWKEDNVVADLLLEAVWFVLYAAE